jgi:hypothetical protein
MTLQSTRKKSKESRMEIMRHMTKVIMSKMEIVQNNKITTENILLGKLYDADTRLWVKANMKK